MKDPARTWNAVVVGGDTPCRSGTRRHERLKACAAHAAARCCRHDSFANPGRRRLTIAYDAAEHRPRQHAQTPDVQGDTRARLRAGSWCPA